MRTFALSAVFLLFCGAAAHAEDSFTGTWDTTFGAVTMVQKDSKVKGSYYDGKASLQGHVDGRKLFFDYQEKNEGGEGEFKLSEDGQSFSGRYKVSGTKKWIEWNGTRK